MKRLTKARIGTSSLVFLSLATCGQPRSGQQLSNTQTGTAPVAAVEKSRPYGDALTVALLRSPQDAKTKKPSPEIPQDKKATRVYVIRVIDAKSKSPVAKANVTVELADSSKTKWQGRTDSKGVFRFTWAPTARFIKAHISVQAPGFWTVDDANALVEERIIQMNRGD